MKRVLSIVLSVFILTGAVFSVPVVSQVTGAPIVAYAKVSANNKKARKLYQKKLNSIKKKDSYPAYQFADVYGNSTEEMIVEYHTGEYGSGCNFKIFTVKKGKAVCILSTIEYGFNKMTVYKKSKSFVSYHSGHGGEHYDYYKLKNGKFRLIASKSRRSVNGGAESNGPWGYYVGETEAAKSDFNKKIKGMQNGRKKVVKLKFYY